jgi:hypothetical protein
MNRSEMSAGSTVRRALSFVGAVLLTAGCGGSATSQGPGFTNISQLNSVWKLNGTYGFQCNGAAENIAINNATVYVFNGGFSTTLRWPSAVCGSYGVSFNGVVNSDGSIAGNVATSGGSSTLSDTLKGTCSATSCSGTSANTSEFSFTMANSGTNPFDGSPWRASLQCSDGGGVSFSGTVSAGAFSGATPGYVTCTSTGHTTISSGTPPQDAYSIKIAPDGTFTASVTQGTGDTLSFTSTFTDLAGTGNSGSSITGTDGARLQFARSAPN